MPFNPPKPKPGKGYKLSQLLEVSIMGWALAGFTVNQQTSSLDVSCFFQRKMMLYLQCISVSAGDLVSPLSGPLVSGLVRPGEWQGPHRHGNRGSWYQRVLQPTVQARHREGIGKVPSLFLPRKTASLPAQRLTMSTSSIWERARTRLCRPQPPQPSLYTASLSTAVTSPLDSFFSVQGMRGLQVSGSASRRRRRGDDGGQTGGVWQHQWKEKRIDILGT